VAKGYLPAAIMNYIALLGWAPESENEIYSLKELEQVFSISRISKSGAIFDIEKLKWMNGIYIRNLTLEQFHELALPYYKQVITRDVDLMELSKALQPRVETLNDILDNIDFINEPLPFDANLFTSKKMKTNPENSLEALKWTVGRLEEIESFSDDEALMNCMMNLAVEKEVKNGRIMWPVRVALSFKSFTAGGAVELAHILGKEESLRRIHAAIEQLEKSL
ncbi:MAG: glutamate--tRNA ligase, partial [Erysipelotrichaceae bacterium]|nr:glutamate--tRNA ligase [Erysipelotrichaceae bacterium]